MILYPCGMLSQSTGSLAIRIDIWDLLPDFGLDRYEVSTGFDLYWDAGVATEFGVIPHRAWTGSFGSVL